MTRNDDDIFKPKLGRMRSRGNAKAKNYINRVLQRISVAGETGFGAARSRRFTGARIGRGNDVLRRHHVGCRFGPASRRVVIKSRIVKLTGRLHGKGIGAARAHLRYIQRDGVTREHEPGRLYDAIRDNADGGAFLERSEGDRHQFRFIVSPEDATEMSDLKPFVRDLMETMESDLGTKLDWVAVDHFNTGHPHTHIVLRGRDDRGKDLVIARDYIAHGMRRRASELLTLELGPQTEQEIRRKLEQQVEQDRFT
ncbi:conjugal transfer protein TraI, partial [Hoeflea sp. E7-10]|nr:conjugal transfer protein TraI [Hoeflea poritis]